MSERLSRYYVCDARAVTHLTPKTRIAHVGARNNPWMAVLLLWLLDASNNTAMEPYRAFIADKLPANQLAKGFLTQSFFTGFGITLATISRLTQRYWAWPRASTRRTGRPRAALGEGDPRSIGSYEGSPHP